MRTFVFAVLALTTITCASAPTPAPTPPSPLDCTTDCSGCVAGCQGLVGCENQCFQWNSGCCMNRGQRAVAAKCECY